MDEAKLLREILDSQQDMVCRFRSDGTILYANRAYAETLGCRAEDLVGASLWNFVTPEDRAGVEAGLRRLTPEEPAVRIENRLETADGTRWTLWRNRGLKWDADGRLLEAQSTGYDITEVRQLEAQRQLLIDELNHRVRNTLTVVQGMAHQTFRGSDIPPAPLAAFNARLHALAGAHSALSQFNWSGAEIAEVVRQGLAICAGDLARVAMAGPIVQVRPAVAVALVLVLHELATNAMKYGALADEAGSLAVTWERDGAGGLVLVWLERGGPPAAPPTRSGFGTRLITSSVRQQLQGEVDFVFASEGLTCRMAFLLDSECARGGVG